MNLKPSKVLEHILLNVMEYDMEDPIPRALQTHGLNDIQDILDCDREQLENLDYEVSDGSNNTNTREPLKKGAQKAIQCVIRFILHRTELGRPLLMMKTFSVLLGNNTLHSALALPGCCLIWMHKVAIIG